MFTPIKHYWRLTTNPTRPTNSTEVIGIEVCIQLIVLHNTIFIQTRQTTFLISETFTSVAAVKNFNATFCHQLLTIFALTNVFECKTLLMVLLLYFALTKTAFKSFSVAFVLLTGITNVIGCWTTATTKLLKTFWTIGPIFTHVNSRIFRDRFSIFILESDINLSLFDKHDITTRTHLAFLFI